MRDEFRDKIKDTLAKRVGYRCSNPFCRKLTSGPHTDPGKVVNIGVASHITAAAPGGVDYDVALTSEERKAINNGIWLCQNCGKLVDNDRLVYPIELLEKWKMDAEKAARSEVEGSVPTSAIGAKLVVSINPIGIQTTGREGERHRLIVKFAITSGNDKPSEEGAMKLIIAYPLFFSRSTEIRFSSADFRSEIGLKLKGYSDEEKPHARSMKISWGTSKGVIIFPEEWHDFYNNNISFEVPHLTTDFNPTYLFQIELITINSPKQTMLFALREVLSSDDLEVMRIDNLDETNYYEITETFWATYHLARTVSLHK